MRLIVNGVVVKKSFSVLRDTPFYGTKLEINQVLLIIKMWVCKVRIVSIAEMLEFSRQTVGSVIKKMKKKLIKNFYAGIEKIGIQTSLLK